MLSGDAVPKIAEAVNMTFSVDPDAEFTVEVNPESVSVAFIKKAMSCGVNRVSIGVQSFDDIELKTLGRRSRAAEAKKAFSMIRDAGITNINTDIMLAIPGQTESSLEKTLCGLISLSPEHVSAYLLKIEDNTVYGKKGVQEAPEEVQREMFFFTSNFMRDAGYEHYEISSYAKPGFRSRHNLGYWQLKPCFAFGAGAHGFDGHERYYYDKNIGDFFERKTEEYLDEQALAEERIMLGLRTSDGVCIPPDKISYADFLVKNGYMLKIGKNYALTDEGFLVSNKIIADIL